MADTDVLDEALLRLHRTGPEFYGWLSNHGPMAADAMIRIGRTDAVERWVDRYLTRLEELPSPRWTIAEDDWRDPLGDPSRLGDWLDYFDRRLDEHPWPDVVNRWWRRLLPGGIAAATHPLIRTGHSIRALLEAETPARIDELGQALGYWAARWAPLPDATPTGSADPGRLFGQLPTVPNEGGARARRRALEDTTDWATVVGTAAAVDRADDVPAALDALVDRAVVRYGQWAPAEPTMLVHMVTAPRAMALALPALDPDVWPETYARAWAISAAIGSMYRPPPAVRPAGSTDTDPSTITADPSTITADRIADDAVRTGDEHAIKFAEVALESDRRANASALPVAAVANRLLDR